MFFSKPVSYLGVDIGAGGVKIVELKKEKNRPVLFTYGFTAGMQNVHRLLEKNNNIESPDNAATAEKMKKQPLFKVDKAQVEKFAAMLKKVCRISRSVSTVAVASLPVSAVFHAVVTLPVVKKEDFDRLLKAEVKKLLPYPLEEMTLEYELMPREEGLREQKVLVNAAPRALVVFYTEVFKLAGIKLESLEPESIALTRSLIGHDESTAMLIDIGAQRTNFFIIEKTFPITHHSIELGGEKINQIMEGVLGVSALVPDNSGVTDKEIVEQMKRDFFSSMLESKFSGSLSRQDFVNLFSPIYEPIIKEIDYSLELYMRQSENEGKRPEKIVLSGGSALFPYLTDIIGETFKIKCYIGDPWGRVVYQDGLKPALREIAPRMSVSIGLALRNVV